MSMASKIVAWSRRGGVFRRKLAQMVCVLCFSFDIPSTVEVGNDVEFLHNGLGTVIHPTTVIRDGAMICQNVTVGDSKAIRGASDYDFGGVVVGRGATVCAGAKVLGGEEPLLIGDGSVVAANAVLFKSTLRNEIWAGVPAKRVGTRNHSDIS